MKALKRIFSIVLILLFILSAVFISYTGIKNGAVVYADDVVNDDVLWTPLKSESDLVKSFQDYCKSRDLTIEGSIADAVTTATTGTFNSCCNTIGINITQLQSEIKAEYDSTGKPVKFLYNTTGINAMNRIFAQFLQDNEIDIDDEDINKVMYSGKWFTDDDGNGCYLFYTNGTSTTLGSVTHEGTNYLYPYSVYKSCVSNGTTPDSIVTHIFEKSYTFDYRYVIDSQGGQYENYRLWGDVTQQNNTSINKSILANMKKDGTFPNSSNQSFYGIAINNSGRLFIIRRWVNQGGVTSVFSLNPNTDKTQDYPTMNINIVANTINNNNYEGNTYTTINNEGDVNNYDTDDEPPVNPDSGGGGGSDTPDYPSPPTGNVNDWGVELPNLDIPWYLQGKEEKFPWNIPFNIMLTLSLLKADPQAPHFEGTMDFKFTTYDYEIDLSEFDDVAAVMRKLEVIAFLIGLMVLTKRLIDW